MKLFSRKSHAVLLSVPEPCSQSWDAMTQVSGGRHCAECRKTVTDFTIMTDRELFAWFKTGRATCGQFYEDQLERAIAAPREPAHPFWMKLGLGLMTLLGLARDGWAQDKKNTPVATAPSPSVEESTSIGAPAGSGTEIKGKIMDQRGDGIPAVSIMLKDSAGRTLAITGTDVNGDYSIAFGVKDSLMVNLFVSSADQQGIIGGVLLLKNQSLLVNYRMPNRLVRGDRQLMIRRGEVRPSIDPRGVHTTHTMKNGE